ncbi:type 2A phosphatase activator TIP41 [Xylariaceae sp. AK1471]|nr:type 2A phosphatase activator TIP41 [Xylariaceae sp. AK1471]
MITPPPPTGYPSQINHINSMNEPWPSPESLAAATRTHRQGAFVIASRKMAILKADPIKALETDVQIPVPEMIFGHNLASITHVPTGWHIEFNARDALDAVDKTGNNMLQVAYAREWSASREQTSAGIREVVRPFDWSYSTTYKGTVVSPGRTSSSRNGHATAGTRTDGATTRDQDETTTAAVADESSSRILGFNPTNEPIPFKLLERHDPILFSDNVMLYESELDDNGISVLSVKFRVHEQRMLLLCRLYMRLDNVVCRIRDTRVYVDFASEVVTRQYTAKEAKINDVKQKLLISGFRPDEITGALRDANIIAELLPTVEKTLESVSLAS